MTRLLWLYPRRWRRRFGLEVEELLAASSRPVRDRLDLLVAAPGVVLAQLRSEGSMNKLDAMRMALAMVLGAGVALTAVAVSQLENGVVELGQHWWSGAPALLVVVSAGGLVVARRAS
ncbi:MAG: hypothetical protein M3353_00720 [Actinomycetota bacterium]|nr:hypothetical protein [Actinomycetota bacterium]